MSKIINTVALRAAAQALVESEAKIGRSLTTSEALEILAQQAGFANYQAFRASVSNELDPPADTPAVPPPEPAPKPVPASRRPRLSSGLVRLGMEIVVAYLANGGRDISAYDLNDPAAWNNTSRIRECVRELRNQNALHAVQVAAERRAASIAATQLAGLTGEIPDQCVSIAVHSKVYMRGCTRDGYYYYLSLTAWYEWSQWSNDANDFYSYESAYQAAEFAAWCVGCAFIPKLKG